MLGVASALGLLLSYLEIGPTSFRIAIFSCIIAGFVAALFHRRSLAQAEAIVAEERQARLATARELREELGALRGALQGGGSAGSLDSVHAELVGLAGKVSALEQSQSAFRDSLMQEMNPGRGRRRGRASDVSTSGEFAASTTENGSAAAYPAPSYEPAYAASSGTPAAYSATDADTADYGSTPYADYDTAGSPAATANQRLAEIFPPTPERGHDAGTGRPSWSAGSSNGAENGSSYGTNGNGRDVSSNPYNDAFAYAGTGQGPSSSTRSPLWESSAASRLASASGAGTPPSGGATRTPWQPESAPSPPASGARTPWSETSQLGDDEDAVAAAVRHGSPRRGRPSDEDPHEVTQTQRLSASEQTAIRRRFLDLSSMDDEGWSRRR